MNNLPIEHVELVRLFKAIDFRIRHSHATQHTYWYKLFKQLVCLDSRQYLVQNRYLVKRFHELKKKSA